MTRPIPISLAIIHSRVYAQVCWGTWLNRPPLRVTGLGNVCTEASQMLWINPLSPRFLIHLQAITLAALAAAGSAHFFGLDEPSPDAQKDKI